MPKLTHQHRPEEGDGESYMNTKRRVFQTEGREVQKTLRQDYAWYVQDLEGGQSSRSRVSEEKNRGHKKARSCRATEAWGSRNIQRHL